MHPGEFIRRVYLVPFDIGSNELARSLKVTKSLVSRLLNSKVDVSPAMALKLSKVLGRSPESWLQMQDNFNLARERKNINLDDYETFSFSSVKMA